MRGMRKRKENPYVTPEGFVCPECNEECEIIPLDNSFSYSGTHCTNGIGGTEYPDDYGSPVTSCCEIEVSQGVCYEQF